MAAKAAVRDYSSTKKLLTARKKTKKKLHQECALVIDKQPKSSLRFCKAKDVWNSIERVRATR